MALKDILLFWRKEKKPKSAVEKELEKIPEIDVKLATADLIKRERDIFFEIYNQFFQLRYSRIHRYFEYDRMDLLSPEIATALDIYTSEILQSTSSNNYFLVQSNLDQQRANDIKELLHRWINYFENRYPYTFAALIRRILKYGDLFLDPILVWKDNIPIGIIGFRILEEYATYQVYIRKNDEIKPVWIYFPKIFVHFFPQSARTQLTIQSLQSFITPQSSTTTHQFPGTYFSPFFFPSEKLLIDKVYFENEKELDEWLKQKQAIKLPYCIHISINPDVFYPFGTSVLEPLRLKWRQLHLLQTALMIYRIFYGVQRKLWKIQFPKRLPPYEQERIMSDIIERIRKTRTFLPESGYDEVSRILGFIEDLFVPESDVYKIDVSNLDTARELQNIEDILLLTREIELGLKIPGYRLYRLRGEIKLPATPLTMEDVRFADYIIHLQKFISKGFKKLVQLHYNLILESEKPRLQPKEIIEFNQFIDDLEISIPAPRTPSEKLKYDTLTNKIRFIKDLIDTLGVDNINFENKIKLIEEELQIPIRKYLKEIKK